jgi:hypothetical protein
MSKSWHEIVNHTRVDPDFCLWFKRYKYLPPGIVNVNLTGTCLGGFSRTDVSRVLSARYCFVMGSSRGHTPGWGNENLMRFFVLCICFRLPAHNSFKIYLYHSVHAGIRAISLQAHLTELNHRYSTFLFNRLNRLSHSRVFKEPLPWHFRWHRPRIYDQRVSLSERKVDMKNWPPNIYFRECYFPVIIVNTEKVVLSGSFLSLGQPLRYEISSGIGNKNHFRFRFRWNRTLTVRESRRELKKILVGRLESRNPDGNSKKNPSASSARREFIWTKETLHSVLWLYMD